MRSILFLSIVLGLTGSVLAGPSVGQVAMANLENSEYAAHRAEVVLPPKGLWEIVSAPAAAVQVYLLPVARQPPESDEYPEPWSPLRKAPDGQAAARDVAWKVVVIRKQKDTGRISLSIMNRVDGQQQKVEWDPPKGAEDPAVLKDLKSARMFTWRGYAAKTSSPVMQGWMQADAQPDEADDPRLSRRRGETTSVFNVLGGRAAIQETLQMQVLNSAARPAGDRTIPVSSLKGVTVRSHPYEQMLKGGKGGALAMADAIPPDCFFIYVSRPAFLLPLLEEGATFLSNGGGAVSGSPIDYDLQTKYLGRLGLDRNWLEAMVKSGAITECSLAFSDLFLIDGTEVTAVSRVAKIGALQPLLKLLGFAALAGDGVIERPAAGGRKSFWAMRGDLLFIATNRDELTRALALHQARGEGSLGQSAEFRYMLTQLPVQAETRLYSFFSDPFIRRLVSPAVKIGQLRRVQARADMEYLTSCGLLARANGIPAESLDALIKAKAVPERYAGSDYEIGPDQVVHSKTYGTLAHMKTLAETPVDTVAAWEAEAYRSYLDGYTRFWRQFFDPIAMRVNDRPDGSMELETFILPLVDNTIYNTVREFVMSREDGKPLNVPELSPKPIVMFSANLRDKAWQNVRGGFQDMLRELSWVNPALANDLGPGIHLAIHDSDPVIALGSGDLLGAFGADIATLGRGGQMLAIPVLLSILTRPCTLMVETRNPAQTKQALRQAARWGATNSRRRGWAGDLDMDFYQVDDKDSWVLSIDLAGIFKLRHGFEVQGNHLLIRNIPWSNKGVVAKAGPAALNGARLALAPAACRIQLPGLHAAGGDRFRAAAMDGMGYLYPLMVAGCTSVAEATDLHARLFGFKPVHPLGGQWQWENQQVVSSLYGSLRQQRQPAYKDGEPDFGVLKNIDSIEIGMQFEDTGLRTQVRWTLTSPLPAGKK